MLVTGKEGGKHLSDQGKLRLLTLALLGEITDDVEALAWEFGGPRQCCLLVRSTDSCGPVSWLHHLVALGH